MAPKKDVHWVSVHSYKLSDCEKLGFWAGTARSSSRQPWPIHKKPAKEASGISLGSTLQPGQGPTCSVWWTGLLTPRCLLEDAGPYPSTHFPPVWTDPLLTSMAALVGVACDKRSLPLMNKYSVLLKSVPRHRKYTQQIYAELMEFPPSLWVGFVSPPRSEYLLSSPGHQGEVENKGQEGGGRSTACVFTCFTLWRSYVLKCFQGPLNHKWQNGSGRSLSMAWPGCLKQASQGPRVLQVNIFGKDWLSWLT